MARTTKTKETLEKRLTALEQTNSRIFELLTKMSQNEPQTEVKTEMTEEEREALIDEQNEQLRNFCEDYGLIAWEITGYSFKTKEGKNHSMTDSEKGDFDAIFKSGEQLKSSGLNSGKSIITFVNVAEVQKVVS